MADTTIHLDAIAADVADVPPIGYNPKKLHVSTCPLVAESARKAQAEKDGHPDTKVLSKPVTTDDVVDKVKATEAATGKGP